MGPNIHRTWWREYSSRRDSQLVYGSEPLSDALIFEPVPYRSALKDNCTHVLVLRTRADGTTVTAKMDFLEKLIMSRFFGRKLGLPDLVSWMHKQYHKLVYAEDVLFLNDANRDFTEVGEESHKTSSLFCVALPPGTPEVKRMETSREAIFNSVRYGFASAFNALNIDPALEVRHVILLLLMFT